MLRDHDPWKAASEQEIRSHLSDEPISTLHGFPCDVFDVPSGFQRELHPPPLTSQTGYSITFSMNPSVLAFSTKVRTLARSNPLGTSASISSFRVTSLPDMVVSCSTMASTI